MLYLSSQRLRQRISPEDRPVRRWSGPVAALLLALLPFADAATDLGSYAVQPGYSLAVDSTGFLLPTSIAFVQEPGTGPDAPLYFVTELHGTVRVVTRDRSVHLFATVDANRGQSADLSGSSQSGLAGVCLDPQRGYVFVTYTEADAGGVLRNRIVRYSSEPGRFGLEPSASGHIDEVLQPFQAAPAHQIGNCLVDGENLYIGVGDGGNPSSAGDPSELLGKVLCFDVEGGPCRDNPFFDGADPSTPDAYVYGYGFRNPFGLQMVNGTLYSAENGVEVDRLVAVERGEDHLWRGTDQSFAAAAELVFTSVISPVQLDYLPTSTVVVDESRRGLFVAGAYGGDSTSSGLVLFAPPGADGERAIPEYLVEYVGEPGEQHLGAVAVGTEAIYFAPMVPGDDGTSDVLSVRYQPAAAHASLVVPRAGLESASHLGPLAERGCVSCHSIAGRGGGIGPTLDGFAIKWRLTERLNSAEYEQRVASAAEPGALRWSEARQDVLEAEGLERTRVWLGYFLQQPGFDGLDVAMPDLGIGESEAEELRTQLFEVLGIHLQKPTLVERALGFFDRNREPLLLGGAAGAFGTLLLFALTIPLGVARVRLETSARSMAGRQRQRSRNLTRSHG